MTPTPRRACYRESPDLMEEVLELFELARPDADLRGRIAAAERVGMRWREMSTPFTAEVGGELVAHVGVVALPLVVAGQEVRAAALHSICAHPSLANLSALSSLVSEALSWAEERASLVLARADAEPFAPLEPHGFRPVRESRFVWEGETLDAIGGLSALDIHMPDGLSILHRLLDQREPVSSRFGVGPETQVYLFNEAAGQLHYAEDLDAIFSLEVEGSVVRLHDVIARRIPPLAKILTRVEGALTDRVERVEVYFPPDKLGEAFRAEPRPAGDAPLMMVRGALALPDDEPFAIPRAARC